MSRSVIESEIRGALRLVDDKGKGIKRGWSLMKGSEWEESLRRHGRAPEVWKEDGMKCGAVRQTLTRPGIDNGQR